MPTAGMYNWNSIASGQSISFWSSASTSGAGTSYFIQSGLTANEGGGQCEPQPPPGHTKICLNGNTWGIWFTYLTSGGVYYGNYEWSSPPGNVQPTDHWYVSGAVYPSKGEISFEWVDSNTNTHYYDWVCNVGVTTRFTGNVGGLSESLPQTGWGTIYWNNIALWAQVNNGQRNVGAATEYNAGGSTGNSPTADHDTPVNAWTAVVGFTSSGDHVPGKQIWSGGYYASNENFPPDHC